MQIDEAELRGAIAKSKSVGDTAFVFDSEITGSDGYGYVCDKAFFEALPRNLVSFLRQGDLIAGASHRRRDLLGEHLDMVRPMPEGDASRFFMTALSGMSPDVVADTRVALRRRPYFLGTIDLVEAAPVARHLDLTLVDKAVLRDDTSVEPGEWHKGRLVPFDGKLATFGYAIVPMDEHGWRRATGSG